MACRPVLRMTHQGALRFSWKLSIDGLAPRQATDEFLMELVRKLSSNRTPGEFRCLLESFPFRRRCRDDFRQIPGRRAGHIPVLRVQSIQYLLDSNLAR